MPAGQRTATGERLARRGRLDGARKGGWIAGHWGGAHAKAPGGNRGLWERGRALRPLRGGQLVQFGGQLSTRGALAIVGGRCVGVVGFALDSARHTVAEFGDVLPCFGGRFG